MREYFEQQTPEHYDGMVFYSVVCPDKSPYNNQPGWASVVRYKAHISRVEQALKDYVFDCMVGDTAEPCFVHKELPWLMTSNNSSQHNF